MISDNKPHTRCVNSARRVPGTASSSHLRCTAQSALAGSWCGAVTQSAPSEPCRPQQRSELRSAQRPFQSSTPSQQVAQRPRQRRHPPQRQLPRQLQRRRCSLAVRLAEPAASPRRTLATRGFGCHLTPSPAGFVRRLCPGSTPRCGGRHTSAHSVASPGPTPDEHTPSRNSRNPTVTAMLNHVRIAPDRQRAQRTHLQESVLGARHQPFAVAEENGVGHLVPVPAQPASTRRQATVGDGKQGPGASC